MRLSIAHVGPDYAHVRGGASMIENGAIDCAALGAQGIKLFASSIYATTYNLEFGAWGAPANLTQLVDGSIFRAAIGTSGLDDIYINCWPFAGFGTGDAWRAGDTTFNAMLAAEYTEIYNAAVAMLSRWAGTGKRIFFQSWEQDWSLTVGDATAPRNTKRSDYLAALWRTRQQAVTDARNANPTAGVQVYYAAEVNLVLSAAADPTKYRTLNYVLPKCQVDFVSWSCYDAINDMGGTPAEWLASIRSNLTTGIAAIRRAAPNSGIYIGEFGWPEAELGVGFSSEDATAELVDTLNDDGGIDSAILWSVWDNEDPRGYYAVASDGTTLSGQGQWFNDNMGGSF